MLKPDIYAMQLLLGDNDLLPWVITMPTEVTTERGFIWFNNTARKNKLIIIKDIRKTFKHKFINYFGNMIGVTGVYFHHGYNSTELKKYKWFGW